MTLPTLVADLKLRLGDHVSVACETVSDAHGLLEGELGVVANAIPKRKAEFAAGRRAARRALAPLGVKDVPLLAAESRAPIWPQGVIGSITHDQGNAFAVAAKTRHVAALGIDLTEAAPLPGETRKSILQTPQEHALNDLDARAAFAIKECVYKALHPTVQRFFGFDAAIAEPDFAQQSFAATLTTDLGPFKKGTVFTGVLLSAQGIIVTALALPT